MNKKETDKVELDHFLTYSIENRLPKEPNAISGRFNVQLYTDRIGGKFSPIYFDEKSKEPERLFIEDEDHPEMIYSSVYPKPKDKRRSSAFGRVSAVAHTVIVPKNLLINKEISLFDLDDAILKFKDSFDFEEKENLHIDKLSVPRRDGYHFEYKNELQNWVAKQSIMDLSSEIMKKNKKTAYICRNASPEKRKTMMIYLIQLLNLDSRLGPLSYSSTRPGSKKYEKFFDIVLSADENWVEERESRTYIDHLRNTKKIEKEESKKAESVYTRINRAFGIIDLEVLTPEISTGNPLLKLKSSTNVNKLTLKIGGEKIEGKEKDPQKNHWIFDLSDIPLKPDNEYRAEILHDQSIQKIKFKVKKSKKPPINFEVLTSKIDVQNPKLKVKSSRNVDILTLKLKKKKIEGKNLQRDRWIFNLQNLSLKPGNNYSAELLHHQGRQVIQFKVKKSKKPSIDFEVLTTKIDVKDSRLIVKSSRKVDTPTLKIRGKKIEGKEKDLQKNHWIFDLRDISLTPGNKYNPEILHHQGSQTIQFSVKKTENEKKRILKPTKVDIEKEYG